MYRFRLFVILLLLTIWTSPTWSQRERETLEAIKREIAVRQRKAEEKQKEEKVLSQKLEALSSEMGRLQGELVSLQTQLKSLELQMARLRTEIQKIESKIQGLEEGLSKRVMVLLKVRHGGALQVLLESQSYGEFLRNLDLLSKLIEAERMKLLQLKALKLEQQEKAIELEALQRDVAKKAYRVQKLKQALALKQSEMEKLLESVRKEKEEELKRIAELQRRKRALEELLARLAREKKPEEDHLNRLKDKLPLPAEGTLKKLPYHEGVAILCRPGTEVRAVGDGKVVFASPFEGYGNLVIIDHGRGYHTVYAYLDQILKRPGERVKAGEVIGKVLEAQKEDGPFVYFEVRHNGRCEPPSKWLALPLSQ